MVRLQTWFWEVIGSHLSRDTGYPDILCFSQSFRAGVRIVCNDNLPRDLS